MVLRNRGRENDKRLLFLLRYFVGYVIDTIVKVNCHSFLLQFTGQRRRRLIVSRNAQTFFQKPAGKCTHTDAPDS